jgi:hypothetical protein
MSCVIETIRKLRRQNAQALADAVRETEAANPSEVELRDAYYRNLRAIPGTLTEGWYMPPPHGIILSIGNPPDFARAGRKSFRPDDTWPNASSRLSSESLVYAYASPVDRNTGLIGDIGCSLYRGGNPAVRQHIHSTWQVTREITEFVKPGMTFAEIFEHSEKIIAGAGMWNIAESIHDGSTTDIGHSVPWSDVEPDESEHQILEHGAAPGIADVVSHKRAFVNSRNQMIVGDNMAVTIEPRVVSAALPMASFHFVVAFESGEKQVITEFGPLLEVFEMEGFDE